MKFSLSQVKTVYWALAALLFSALAVTNLQAQVTTAVLSGTVVDASGAVVPGVKIQATDVGTGTSYAGTTDGSGRYSLPEMPVGTYNVSAEKTGFQKMVQTGIVLTVGAHPVLDFSIKVGRIEEVVQVQGQTSNVDTSSAAVGQLVSPTQMGNLPLNGRNFTQLLTLAPGVATVPMTGGGGGQSGTAYGEQTNYSVSGSRPEGLEYLLDGTDIRDALDHGAGVNVTGTSLGMDAIQEFTALTNTYGAQFGGTGVAINAVTKSGTNNLHGSAYEYIRNSKLDAENYFDVSGVKPPFKRNQFGGTLGGPIKKDKTFFFINYEGFRSDQGQTARAVVPVTDGNPIDQTFFEANGMLAGGPTGYYGGPLTGLPTVPMNSATESIFALEPASQSDTQCPNVTNILLLPGEALSCSVGGLIQNEDYGLARIDYTIGPKDSMFARYDIENAFQSVPYSTNIISTAVPGYPEIDNERNQYTTIEERHVFSPKLLNEARFGFVRLNLLTADGGLNVTNGSTALDTVPGRQDMSVALGGGIALGALPSSPSHDVMNRFSAGDDVTMTLGAHTLHFGATYTREQTNDFWLQYSGGDWIFISLQGGGPLGPLGSSFFGIPLFGLNLAAPTYSYPAPNGQNYPLNPERAWRQHLLEPYIQDDWKINKRLTVNLGVRYEWASNPGTANNQTFVLPTADETNLGKTSIMTTAPTEGSFVPADKLFASNPNAKNIDPRIGVAFDPFADHKTSIRAGFAMYHESVTSRTYTFMAPNPTEPTTETFFPFYFPNEIGSFADATSPANAPGIVWFYGLFPTVNTSPYMMQYNLTVQRQLLPGTVFNIGYNGSTGVHLFAWINGNPSLAYGDLTSAQLNAVPPGPPGTLSLAQTFAGTGATGQGARGTLGNPFVGIHENGNFGSFMATEPFAHSSYNSLQTSLTRQFSASLAGNVAYTWSKCIDNASATVSSEQGEYAIINAYNPSFDRGPCSFNSNQVFSANAVYNLPFHGNRAVSGWQISPIVSDSRGLPINIQTFIGLYQSNINGATEGERPSLVPGCNPMVRSVHEWYNPACYVLPPFGTLGNVGRDSINNPNYFDWDFALVKNTKLTELLNMEIRAEFFDIVNHPNFIVGPQVLNWDVAAQITPTNPNYSLLSTPSAYVQPTATTAGGLLCNPSGLPESAGGAPVQVCYTPTTALGTTVPSSLGAQREIQFAVKFTF